MKKFFVFLLFISTNAFPQITEVVHTMTNNRASSSTTPVRYGFLGAWSSTSTPTNYTTGGISVEAQPGGPLVQPIGTGTYTEANANGYLASGAAGDKIIIYASQTISRTGKRLAGFTWETANQFTTSTSRPFVIIGTSAFAWGSGQAQSVASGASASTAFATASQSYSATFDETASNWFPVTMTAGSLISLGAAQTISGVAGDVTGFGVYFEKASNSGTVRTDNWVLTMSGTLTVPTTPSAVTVTGASVDWTYATGYPTPTDYQYSENAGATWTDVTTKPFSLNSAVYYAPYQIGIRVKPVAASRTNSQAAWNASAYAPANLVYKETFTHPNSNLANSAAVSLWRQIYNSGATASGEQNFLNSGVGSSELAPLNAYWPFFNTAGHVSRGTTGTIHAFYTNYNVNISSAGRYISKVRFKTAHNNNTTTGRFIGKKNGNWYALKTGVLHTPTSTNTNPWTTYTQQNEFTATNGAAEWYLVTLTPETTEGALDGALSVSGTPTTLPLAGDWEGFGILFEKSASNNNSLRFDDLEVFMTSTGAPQGLHIMFYGF